MSDIDRPASFASAAQPILCTAASFDERVQRSTHHFCNCFAFKRALFPIRLEGGEYHRVPIVSSESRKPRLNLQQKKALNCLAVTALAFEATK